MQPETGTPKAVLDFFHEQARKGLGPLDALYALAESPLATHFGDGCGKLDVLMGQTIFAPFKIMIDRYSDGSGTYRAAVRLKSGGGVTWHDGGGLVWTNAETTPYAYKIEYL